MAGWNIFGRDLPGTVAGFHSEWNFNYESRVIWEPLLETLMSLNLYL